ncbi:MAG: type II toxin-antitoxin system VapC family toxin [Rhodospirillales bacterium]|nr:MAG: type II toxin-antitoxin system VapC family toxin [Rhodospirillales bacterium]
MTVILDSHVLLWLMEGRRELGRLARARCDEALRDDAVGVSAVTFYELANEHRKGRIALSPDPATWRQNVLALGVVEFPVDAPIAIEAAGLADMHNDPMDRLIVATVLRNDATLMTADGAILRWKAPLSRLDAAR